MKKFLLLIALFTFSVFAQSGKNAIYRCGNTYSNVPCVGAKEVNTTPTRGADSLSGQQRISYELMHDDTWRTIHQALNTLRGSVGIPKNNETYQETKRRSSLTYSQRQQCQKLKEQFKKPMTEKQLYELRLKYSRC